MSDVVDCMKALAHPVRWRILEALQDGERNVGEIETMTQIAQPGLSQQLAVLRKAGIVETRKQAKLVYYSLDPDALAELADAVLELCDKQTERTTAPRQRVAGAANFARLS